MDKTIAGLLGAVSALAVSAPGQAAPAQALSVASYAELLQPIPDALQTLRALDAQALGAPDARVEEAQYYGYPYASPYPPPPPYYYHHHHHHHRYYRRHHHHHHHNGFYGRPY